MVTRKIIHLIAILFMLTACNGMRVSERLDQIDSLIVKEQYDSAYVVLNSLGKTSMTEEEQAHYYLLSSQLGFITNQPLPSDSLLDLAITYYNKVENHQKLADVYYYKSYRSIIGEDYTQAIKFAKKAERLSVNSNDKRLKYKITEVLAYLNGVCNNDLLQLQYGKKALAIAQSADNKNWIASSYNKICFAFSNLGQYDSALYYVEKSVPYLDYVREDGKAQYLTNIGQLYKKDNPQKAIEYYEKALACNELPETLEYLADTYYAQGCSETVG